MRPHFAEVLQHARRFFLEHRAPYAQVRKAAERMLHPRNPGLPPGLLAPVLVDCAAQLVDRFAMDPDDAGDVALSVWSEHAGRSTGCYVDLAVTTPWLVFIVDPATGHRRAVPIADLVRMMGPRLVSAADHPTKADRQSQG